MRAQRAKRETLSWLLDFEGCVIADQYQVGPRMLCGGYAEIYLARELASGAEVIVKALNPHLRGPVSTALVRTLLENHEREARLLARLRHRHIIELLGQGEVADRSGHAVRFLVLEHLPGGTLAAWRNECGLDWARAWSLIEQCCVGLAYAHAQGVIHRDVKPENLLLTADRQTVKLADFGVARETTATGEITEVGSRLYAAPEQFARAAGAKQLTAATDVYALAKTVYFVLSGTAPEWFVERPITHWPAAAAGQAWAQMLLPVLRQATADEAAARPQSAQAFWRALRAHLPERTKVAANSTLPNGGRSRIVIPFVAEPPRTQAAKPAATAQTASRAVPAQPAQLRQLRRAVQRAWLKRSWLQDGRWAILAGLCVVIAAALAVVVPRITREQSARPNAASSRPQLAAGNEMVTVIEVKLRPEPSVKRAPLSVVPRGSRVRVSAVQGEWCFVTVLRQPVSMGWITTRALKLETGAPTKQHNWSDNESQRSAGQGQTRVHR